MAAGSAALDAENRKKTKYAELLRNYTFVPFAVETFGVWGPDARCDAFSSKVGARLAEELRSTSFLRQRIDIAIQRGNALAVRASFKEDFMNVD